MDFSGNEGRYLPRIASEAKPKLNAVEKACYICGRFAGPKFVTTPGSAFSAFASLIYEIATGEKDASMQGAVNRLKAGERPSLSALDWGTDTARIPTIEMRNIELQYHLRRSRFLVALLKDKEDQYTLFERSLISRIAEANLKEAEAAAAQLATSREAQSKQR